MEDVNHFRTDSLEEIRWIVCLFVYGCFAEAHVNDMIVVTTVRCV